MLSSITPLVERGKGHRFMVTAVSFVVGSTLGGAALGGLVRVVRVVMDAVAGSPSVPVAFVGIGAACVICGLIDLLRPNARLWGWRRQVDERWLDEFRGYVYGLGFGAQLGFGLVTIISSASIYAMVVAAALQPAAAGIWAVAVTFGLTRGVSVFATARVVRREQLLSFHRRLALAEPLVGRMTGLGLTAVGVLALTWGGR